jgi:DNA-binding response OmpR family regulator
MGGPLGFIELSVAIRPPKPRQILHNNRGKVVDRNTLIDHCWGQNYLPNSRTLDQHISKLRKLIEKDPQNPEIIRTVHGVGYRYDS